MRFLPILGRVRPWETIIRAGDSARSGSAARGSWSWPYNRSYEDLTTSCIAFCRLMELYRFSFERTKVFQKIKCISWQEGHLFPILFKRQKLLLEGRGIVVGGFLLREGRRRRRATSAKLGLVPSLFCIAYYFSNIILREFLKEVCYNKTDW